MTRNYVNLHFSTFFRHAKKSRKLPRLLPQDQDLTVKIKTPCLKTKTSVSVLGLTKCHEKYVVMWASVGGGLKPLVGLGGLEPPLATGLCVSSHCIGEKHQQATVADALGCGIRFA